jgi:hypothetical protein
MENFATMNAGKVVHQIARGDFLQMKPGRIDRQMPLSPSGCDPDPEGMGLQCNRCVRPVLLPMFPV